MGSPRLVPKCVGVAGQQWLTPVVETLGCGGTPPQHYSPLRTTGSQLQCIIRDILYNFIKFNVHFESFMI